MTTWVIEHGFYGCETGCCGYELRVEGEDAGNGCWKGAYWTFDHPYPKRGEKLTDEDLVAFARETFGDIQPDDLVFIGEWRSCGT